MTTPRVLQRRGALGIRFEPLANGAGIRVLSVAPNSSAAHGSIQPGEVLLAGDTTTFTSEAVFRAWAAQLRAGDTVMLHVERAVGSIYRTKLYVYSRPHEASEGVEHQYTQATLQDGTLVRVILSRPVAPTKPLARVLLLPGYRRDSWDWPTAPDYPLRRWVDDVVRAGFGVVRVERRGLGDSEGEGDAQGFDAERADLLEGARTSSEHWFYGLPWIVYGYSLGGLHAPLIAPSLDARGVAVWGSGIDTWTEYLDALLRRRMTLEARPEPAIERAVRAQQALYATVHIRGETVAQALARSPLLREHQSLFGCDPERNALDGRCARFWREVYACPTAESLAALDAPVLSLWGECDWITDRAEHERIARVARRGTFTCVARADHGYTERESPLEALRGSGAYTRRPALAFVEWARALTR
jgi:pimeloyl-ACP methyl ester carboxylesterase